MHRSGVLSAGRAQPAAQRLQSTPRMQCPIAACNAEMHSGCVQCSCSTRRATQLQLRLQYQAGLQMRPVQSTPATTLQTLCRAQPAAQRLQSTPRMQCPIAVCNVEMHSGCVQCSCSTRRATQLQLRLQYQAGLQMQPVQSRSVAACRSRVLNAGRAQPAAQRLQSTPRMQCPITACNAEMHSGCIQRCCSTRRATQSQLQLQYQAGLQMRPMQGSSATMHQR